MMSLLGLFKRKNKDLPKISVPDDEIVAIGDGQLFDVAEVKDPTFSQKLLGDSVAFKFPQDKISICSPANGTLTTVSPTGHAFGITTNDGVEILVHIGIDTVNAKGDGFTIEKVNQNDKVAAGDPIVTVDLKKLRKNYDMSTMLIITNPNNKKIEFIAPQEVKRGQSIIK